MLSRRTAPRVSPWQTSVPSHRFERKPVSGEELQGDCVTLAEGVAVVAMSASPPVAGSVSHSPVAGEDERPDEAAEVVGPRTVDPRQTTPPAQVSCARERRYQAQRRWHTKQMISGVPDAALSVVTLVGKQCRAGDRRFNCVGEQAETSPSATCGERQRGCSRRRACTRQRRCEAPSGSSRTLSILTLRVVGNLNVRV